MSRIVETGKDVIVRTPCGNEVPAWRDHATGDLAMHGAFHFEPGDTINVDGETEQVVSIRWSTRHERPRVETWPDHFSAPDTEAS